jgi:hypothetical protein
MKRSTLSLFSVLTLLVICKAHADSPGYVILTTTGIVAQSSELTNFVAAKEARGFTVQVVQNTSSTQGGWCGNTNALTGDLAAQHLRNWLTGHYTNAGGSQVIEYALLIGNPNPTNGDVPMKLCYPRNTNESSATDYYYADLSGNWDINSNGFCGEWADFSTNGGPDLTSEVLVGRIPFYGSIFNLDTILRHTIQYENALARQSSWRSKVLLPASPVEIGWPWNPYRGFLFAEHIKNDRLAPASWAYHRVYDQTNGLTPPPETMPCSPSNVAAAWNTANPGAVFWFQHGNPTYTVDIMDSDTTSQLNSTNQAFVFQGSCLNANPETTNNLAYMFLLRGCISATAATRSSWWRYTTWNGIPVDDPPPWSYSGTVPHLVDGCAQRFVNNGLSVGNTLAEYREDVVPPSDTEWENYCIFNIYGCPAVGIRSVKFSGPMWSF